MENYLNKVLGERYEIQEIIGVGGMAVVYKAYDRVDDRVVAVKILKDEFLANEEFRLRFKNESKVISMLSHPNIVKVYDVSFGENLQYIVMEHVEGITLKEYIEMQKALDWKEALHFVVQILRALQHAHDKGIIHRDIKPQNILLLPNANIKVTDFGIARFNRSEKNIIESSAIGSVRYMSPEQTRGEQADGRADIYAVGVVLYEMLTGRVPFDADSDISVALMQLREDAVKPSAINSSVPLGLEQITLRAMRKDPCERYQSAAEFLLDLDEFKRNPQIEFDYTYFLDKSPTKYVSPVGVTQDRAPVRITDEPEETDDVSDGDIETQDDEPDDAGRKKMIPILAGIAAAFVLIVVLIVALAFADPIRELMGVEKKPTDGSSFVSKLDVFGLFSKDTTEVPNFLNMDYNEALEKYPDLVIENPPQYVYNSQYEDGHVCDQYPSAGEKISSDTVIKLTVVTSSSMILVKDVTGLDCVEAETVLRSLGLKVELVPTPNEEKNENEVINTVPSVNTYVANNSTVYVYYASNDNEVGSVRVPSVVGDELAIAKAKITAKGLRVGAITYESSAEQLKDYVIGQNPATGNSAKSGTYVNLVVGNGIPASNTVTFTINLPKSGTTGTLKTYLNNNCYDIVNDVEFNGGKYQLSFTGSGADNSFKIFADSSLICSGKVDFTTPTPSFSEVSSYTYYARERVPDVIGLNETQARAELSKAGFKNVSISNAYSDTVPEGRVISQTPVSTDLTTYSTSTNVTLQISLGHYDSNATSETSQYGENITVAPIIPESTTVAEASSSVEEQSTTKKSAENSTAQHRE